MKVGSGTPFTYTSKPYQTDSNDLVNPNDILHRLETQPFPTMEAISNTLRQRFENFFQGDNTDDITHYILTILHYAPDLRCRFYTNEELKLHPDAIATLNRKKVYQEDGSTKYLKNPTERPKEMSEVIKFIASELSSLVFRPPVTLERDSWNQRKIRYIQECGHMSQTHTRVTNYSISSSVLDFSMTTSSVHNFNLARIYEESEGQKIQLLVRSGRTDNPNQLIKLIQYHFLASLESTNQPGITKKKDGSLHFQMVLVTGQDPNYPKSATKMIVSPIDKKEPQSLTDMKNTVEKVWWLANDPIPLVVKKSNGEEVVFFAEKPLLFNCLLTRSANNPELIETTRSWSEQGKKKVQELLSKKLDENEYNKVISSLELPQDTAFSPLAPAIELIQYFTLFDTLNLAVAVQCKRGCDRALVMTGLFLAKRHLEKHLFPGNIFDLNTCTKEEKEVFAKEFSAFAGEFGLPIVQVSRGKPEVKASEKSIIHHLFDETDPKKLENIIPKIRLVSGT